MTNMSEDMAETSVTDFFTLPKLGRVHPCLVSTMPQKWTAWKLTPMPPMPHTTFQLPYASHIRYQLNNR